MCGIFAYLNYDKERTLREIMQILINGLKRLEYRGYDSAGICFDGGDQGSMTILKKVGPVRVLEAAAQSDKNWENNKQRVVKSHLGISHTRWATHGEPCDKNSHPITSNDENDFVVVHNGIITNYAALRTVLSKHGFVFKTDTDTETIAMLLKYSYDESTESDDKLLSFSELVMNVLDHLEGAFALVVKSRHYPNEVVACKRGSPLIVGLSGNAHPASTSTSSGVEIFFSSDATSLVEHTRRVMYLEDNDLVHVSNGDMRLINTSSEQRKELPLRALHTLEMEIESIRKGKYSHFMQKEIFEQPESIVNTMRGRIDFKSQTVTLGGFKGSIKEQIKRARRIVFIGCGSSYYSAVACRSILEELIDVPVTIELASDFNDRTPPVFRDDVVCFVSQSGETADTLRCLEYCKEKQALCVGFCNTVGSSIARITDCGTHINAGCEVGVASTKAYTSQIVCYLMLALLLSEDSISKKERRSDIFKGLQNISETMRKALDLDDEMKSLAKALQNERSILLMGRGYQYATCLEGALKIKELAYIHTEGILAGELKHGPLALIDENMPVIMMASKDELYLKVKSSLQQILSRKGRPIVFLSEADPDMESASQTVMLPKTVDCLQPLINVIPLQLLAYHLAVWL